MVKLGNIASSIYQQFLDGRLTREEALFGINEKILDGTIDLTTGNQYVHRIEFVEETTEKYWKSLDETRH